MNFLGTYATVEGAATVVARKYLAVHGGTPARKQASKQSRNDASRAESGSGIRSSGIAQAAAAVSSNSHIPAPSQVAVRKRARQEQLERHINTTKVRIKKVEVMYNEKWYKATIISHDCDFRANVRYNDGSVESSIDEARIRCESASAPPLHSTTVLGVGVSTQPFTPVGTD